MYQLETGHAHDDLQGGDPFGPRAIIWKKLKGPQDNATDKLKSFTPRGFKQEDFDFHSENLFLAHLTYSYPTDSRLVPIEQLS